MLTTLVIKRIGEEYKKRMVWDEFFNVVEVLIYGDMTFCCIICFKGGVVEIEVISKPN
jgi:hypothetical protein